MKYLFCVTGYSSSGKDLFIEKLTKATDIKLVKTLSTRPKRNSNESGTTECVSEEEFFKERDAGRLLEVRSYQPAGTVDVWFYGTPVLSGTDEMCILATAFDQLRNIYCNTSRDEYMIIPIGMDVHPSILLYRSIMRALGDLHDFEYAIEDDDFVALSRADEKAPESASRFIRDLEEQAGLKNLPSSLKKPNNNDRELYRNIYSILCDINTIRSGNLEKFLLGLGYHNIQEYNAMLDSFLNDGNIKEEE